jgi:hypothetical protein
MIRRIQWRKNSVPSGQGGQGGQAGQVGQQGQEVRTDQPSSSHTMGPEQESASERVNPLRLPLRHGAAALSPPTRAFGLPGLELRCVMWLLAVIAFDFQSRLTAALLISFCLLDLWFFSRLAPPGDSARWVVSQVTARFKQVSPQAWIFVGIMLLNLALEHLLVEQVARPFLFNNLALNGILLVWACLTTPHTRAARAALHRWATVIICALAALLLVQLVLYYGLGFALDIRDLLTGEASRSGIEEGSEGERPTAIFVEPSCLAIVAFGLTLIARLTGPQRPWLTLVAALTCLLNNSGIGLFLAGFLFIEEALTRLKKHLVLAPLLVATFAAVAWLAAVTDATDFKLLALDQIIHPTTRYDPIAMRMYVPLRILNFDGWDHLMGLGIANFAAFKDGFTQYDSSFLLGVYYQTGLLGMPILVLTLVATWRVHSLRAALMLAALYATKMSLSCTLFWALVFLTHYGKAICPPETSSRKQRPLAPLWTSLLLTCRGAVAATGLATANPHHASPPQTTPRQPVQSTWAQLASRNGRHKARRDGPSPTLQT